MADCPKKAVLIGLDGAVPQIVEQLAADGELPNLARLMDNGTSFRALNPFPTITSPNWTTLATGSWPGRHGITSYFVHHPGEPLDKLRVGFNTAECATEHIWEAAEKVGKRSIVVNYETSWPPTFRSGIVVHGCGPNYHDEFHAIFPEMLFSDVPYPGATLAPLKEDNSGAKVACLSFRTAQGETRCFYVKVNGDAAVVFKDEKFGEPLAETRLGHWSQWVSDTFAFQGTQVDCTFRYKLLSLPQGQNGEFKLLCSTIFPNTGWTHPDTIGPELIREVGPFPVRGGWEAKRQEWITDEEYVEMQEQYNDWIGRATAHLMGLQEWDIVYAASHTPDYAHHLYMVGYDPLTAARAAKDQAHYEKCMHQLYAGTDHLVGLITQAVDKDTLVIVVSDHGGCTWMEDEGVEEILQDAGLLVRRENPKTGLKETVWEETKAFPQRGCYVYVNLKGRDPQGIVEPGQEYENVRDQVIAALYDHVHQPSGKRPYVLALRREDSRMIGLYGDRVGDVVYAHGPEFGHEHGSNLPTARYGRGSIEATLILSGPGIRKSQRRQGTTGIQDVVPTICYLLDIPFPRGCDGAIIYDALEDPGVKMHERASLEEELRRWKAAYERQASQTHTR